MEEALKMRNLLQEFLKKNGVRNPTILGLREHIFTGRYRNGLFYRTTNFCCYGGVGEKTLLVHANFILQ